MKTVFLLFDSLNRRMLDPYGSIYLENPRFTYNNCNDNGC